MNNDISRIIGKTLGKEGVYSSDPDDPGGETKWGISKRAHPDLDIKALSREQAIEIYAEEYYAPFDFTATDRIDYRWKLFDIGVNMGLSVARKFRSIVAELMPDYDTAVDRLCILQANRYESIIRNNPSQAKYRKGWLARAGDHGADLLA